MKAVIVVLILAAAGLLVLNYTRTSIDEGFDPTEQGQQTRAIVEKCKTWTEVLDRADEPRKWRDAHSEFDFFYTDEFTADTRSEIDKRIKLKELPNGFSFFYRFSDAVTFAVNFDRHGEMLNIQDKESKAELLDKP